MKRVAVFCGSRPGSVERFRESAAELGTALVESGRGLVYGGGKLGLMGILADSVLKEGGEVIGVIPEALEEREQAHTDISELIVVDTMHERKRIMAERADGFIAMPGGLGTLEETLEVWTWAQLGLHQKPLGLFDVDGFYRPLIDLLFHMVEFQFVQVEHVEMVHVSDDPQQLLGMMEGHEPPPVRHWIQEEDI